MARYPGLDASRPGRARGDGPPAHHPGAVSDIGRRSEGSKRKHVSVIVRVTGSGEVRIGVIGSGHIGGTIGGLWVKAGHPVLFSSRHPEELKGLVSGLGSLAQAGTVAQAVAFGDALFVAVRYKALGRSTAPRSMARSYSTPATPLPRTTVQSPRRWSKTVSASPRRNIYPPRDWYARSTR